MNQNLNFSIEARDSFNGNGNLSDIQESTKEFTIFQGSFFLVGDQFNFPPIDQARVYLDDFKGNQSPVANIAKNGVVNWRPVKSFCRICAKDSADFFAKANAKAKEANLVSCNRDLVECGDIKTLLETFAGKTIKVIARVDAYKGIEFKKGVGATKFAETTLPVFAYCD